MGTTMRRVSICLGITLLLGPSPETLAKPFEYQVSPEEQHPNRMPIGVFTDAAVDYSRGLYSTSFPITLPPGRNGLTPQLALEYHSTKVRTPIGIGWDLPLDHVRLSLRHGTPPKAPWYTVDLGDFEFRLGDHAGTLVYIGEENGYLLYRPKIEGAFAKFYYSIVEDRWMVQDTSGKTWYLGDSGARDRDPSMTGTFAWYVSRVVDPLQNMIQYEYFFDSGNLYPRKITYDLKEGQSPAPYAPYVKFNYDSDFIPKAISYQKGYRAELDARFLETIEIHAYDENGNPSTRQVTLEVGWEEPEGPTIVRSITPEALSTATFHYYTPSFSLDTVRDFYPSVPSAAYEREVRSLEVTRVEQTDPIHYVTTSMLVDMDGDGDLDQLVYVNGNRQWRKNTGWNFESNFRNVNIHSSLTPYEGLRYSESISGIIGSMVIHQYQNILDMDGDGKADWVSTSGGSIYVCAGDGTGNFGYTQEGCANWGSDHGGYLGFISITFDTAGLLDVNGDGLPDQLVASETTQGDPVIHIHLNQGRAADGTARGFDPIAYVMETPIKTFTIIDTTFHMTGIRYYVPDHMHWDLRDMNGDGIVDLVTDADHGGKAFYGQGPFASSFFDRPANETEEYKTFTNNTNVVNTDATDGDHKKQIAGLYDLNADGLLDMVQYNEDTQNLEVWRNIGWHFADPVVLGNYVDPPYAMHDGIIVTDNFDMGSSWEIRVRQMLIDFDGDGRLELVRGAMDSEGAGGPNDWRAITAPDEHQPADFLRSLESGAAKDLISYAKPVQDTVTSNIRNWTVKQLTQIDQATGEQRTQDVEVKDPVYDPIQRVFRGHKEVNVTEAQGERYQRHYFHTGEFNHGKEYQWDTWKTWFFEMPARQVETNWEDVSLSGGERYWIRPKTVTTRITDPGVVTTTATEESYAYFTDELSRDMGLLSSVTRKGFSSSAADDDRVTSYTYFLRNNTAGAPSSENPLLARTYTETMSSGTGAQAEKTIHLYDEICDHVVAGDPNTLPPAGAVAYFDEGLPCQHWVWRQDIVPQYGISKTEYDAHGRLIYQRDPDLIETQYAYHGDTPYLESQTNDLNHKTTFREYHALSGKPTMVCGPDYESSPEGDNCDTFTYDKYGRPREVWRDFDEGASSWPLLTEEYQYINGDPSTPASVIAIRYQDPISTLHAPQQKETYFNRWSQVVHEVGAITSQFQASHFQYDTLGRLQKAWLPYSTTNRNFEATPPEGPEYPYYTYNADALDRTIQSTHKNGAQVTITYRGAAVDVQDESGKTTTYEHNGFGETAAIERTVAGQSLRSTYTYDAAGRLSTATDETNGTYTYQYYGDGTLARTELPQGTYTYERTRGGRLTRRQTEWTGAAVEYTYDTIGRVATRTVTAAGTGGDQQSPTQSFTFTYDEQTRNIGRLTSVTSSELSRVFDYDGLGNLSNKSLMENSGLMRTLSVDMVNTPFGAPLAVTYPSGRRVVYTYDIAGNVMRVDDDQNLDVEISHLPGGRPETISGDVEGSSYYDLWRQYSYDDHHRLVGLSSTLGQLPWYVYRSYEPNGRMSSLNDNQRGSWAFSYDEANRLTSAIHDGSPITYTYKKNGALATVNTAGTTETYQYTSPTMHKLSLIGVSGSTTRVYHNQAGQIYSQLRLLSNPLMGYSRSYTWYGDGNLASITHSSLMGGQTSVRYDYDESGQRWRRAGGGTSTLYFDDLAEKRGNEELIEYVHVPHITIELRQQGDHRIHYSDGLNTAMVVTEQGTIDHELDYFPYGTKTALTGSPDATFNFNQKRQEPTIGTLYYGARHYEPSLRQFLSVDPLRLEGVSDVTDGANVLQPYVYAAADPVTFRDEQGLKPLTIEQNGPPPRYMPFTSTCMANCQPMTPMSSIEVFERFFGPRMESAERREIGEKALLYVFSAMFAYATVFGPTAVVGAGGAALVKAESAAAKWVPALRQQYVEAVTGLAGRVPGMRQAGMSSEQIARALHAERRALGVRFKDLTPAEKLAEIHARNLERYGDKLGPSIEWLRNAGKSWDDIIESATRAGGKDLGF